MCFRLHTSSSLCSETPWLRRSDEGLVSAQPWASVKGSRAGRLVSLHMSVKQPKVNSRDSFRDDRIKPQMHTYLCQQLRRRRSASHSPRVALATHWPSRATPRCRKVLRIAAEVMCREGYPPDFKCLQCQGSRGQPLSHLEETEEKLHITSAHQREVETTSALFSPALPGMIGGWRASTRAHCAGRWRVPGYRMANALVVTGKGWMDAGSAQLQINRSDILIDCPVDERPTRGGCGYRGAQANLLMADTLTPRSTAPTHPQTVPDGSPRRPTSRRRQCPLRCPRARRACQPIAAASQSRMRQSG